MSGLGFTEWLVIALIGLGVLVGGAVIVITALGRGKKGGT